MAKKDTSKQDEKNSDQPAVMSPVEIAKQHKKESEERKEAASFRFPEGEDFDGKIITAEDTLSEKKKTPCYEITVKTKELNKKGKKASIIIRFMKNPKSMGFLYAFLEMAGADLSKLRYKKQETLDEDIQKLLEKLEEENPIIVFNCVHQDESTYNNYYVNKCDDVLGDVLKKNKAQGDDKEEKESESDDKEESSSSDSDKNEDSSGANSDSAFDDDDDWRQLK